MCEYCYCKKGVLASQMGQDKPQLKKCFKNEEDALVVFEDELIVNLEELKGHGLFFSFTTDPMLPETNGLTLKALYKCLKWHVPVKILTKCTGWLNSVDWKQFLSLNADWSVSFGFTLTGHDELEGRSASNMERIRALVDLHKAGYRTFASIEPIVDFVSAYSMISLSHGACDLYKIGLMSGKRYNAKERSEAECFFEMLKADTRQKFYLKDTLITLLKLERKKLPNHFVDRDYNMFNT